MSENIYIQKIAECYVQNIHRWEKERLTAIWLTAIQSDQEEDFNKAIDVLNPILQVLIHQVMFHIRDENQTRV